MRETKRIKGMLVVLGVIMMGVTNAKAGLIMSDITNNDNPCTESIEKKDGANVDHGVIVVGLMQIFGKDLIESFFGKDERRTGCGVMVVG